MTRRGRTNGSVESRLDALETDASADTTLTEVLWRDDRTGGLLDNDGEPADPDPNAHTIVFDEAVVAYREQAEAEGYDILGPAKDVPHDDVVRVAADSVSEEST